MLFPFACKIATIPVEPTDSVRLAVWDSQRESHNRIAADLYDQTRALSILFGIELDFNSKSKRSVSGVY